MIRRGHSLIELLVVMAFVAILVGLQPPAMQKVREAANRARHQNNLKQIALGIHFFHDANRGRFPVLCDFGVGSPTGKGMQSLHFQILPFVEGDSVYKLYDPKNPASYNAKEKGAAGTLFRTYLNPNDPSAPNGKQTEAEFTMAGTTTKGYYATTSYAVNGMIFQPGAGLKTMIDGTSQTIMVGERYQVCKMGKELEPAKATDEDVYCLWGMGAYGAATPAFATPFPLGGAPAAKPALAQFAPQSPVATKAVPGKLGNTAIDSYEKLAAKIAAPGGFQVAPAGATVCDARVPQTSFASGIIVALGDASTRSIKPNITPTTFWSAVTPAGNEMLGGDW